MNKLSLSYQKNLNLLELEQKNLNNLLPLLKEKEIVYKYLYFSKKKGYILFDQDNKLKFNKILLENIPHQWWENISLYSLKLKSQEEKEKLIRLLYDLILAKSKVLFLFNNKDYIYMLID